MKLLLIIIVLLCSCSTKLIMSDSELREAQNQRNKKVMLNNGILIIPPDFDNIPVESESQYVAPAKK